VLRSVQVEDIKSDNNVFLEAYGVPQIAKRILQMTNIVVPHDLFMLTTPYAEPGTYRLPLALLDDNGQQVHITVQLTPRQASFAELAGHENAEGEGSQAH
jgi:hypothetical protein